MSPLIAAVDMLLLGGALCAENSDYLILISSGLPE
jgi:hypothetical protein